MENFLAATLVWIAAHPGWMALLIFLTALGESLALVGMLIPGAMLMFGFGALIALGHLEFWSACGYAVAGAVAGDALSFWLGRTCQQRLRRWWPFSRHPDMLGRGEIFFRRHGGKSVLFGRFFGPVRAVVPAVAGMLDMPAGRFLAVNMLSALLWAPAYLLPGMVFAASLELAAQVAWRLVVLIVLLVALVGLTVTLVRRLFVFVQPRAADWLHRFAIWSRHRTLFGPVAAALLNPPQGELRGLLLLALLLLGGFVLIDLLLAASGHALPTPLDYALYRFLQDLRTPWADTLMVAIAELGGSRVALPMAAAVAAWLCWRRAYRAALHWLGALLFGVVLTMLLQWLLQVPRPPGLAAGVRAYGFPSGHAVLGAVLFGFLAVLVARETRRQWRWLPYLSAALLAVLTGFAQLYLGGHWLTDVLAGLCLGLLWVLLLGLGYYRHAGPLFGRAGLLASAGVALVVAELVYAGFGHEAALQQYQPPVTRQVMTQADWWRAGWRQLAVQRVDFRGQPQQELDLQWAAPAGELLRRLHRAGWQPALPLTVKSALQWLNPQAGLAQLPVLPRVHAGRHEAFALVYPGPTPDSRWVLRFWATGVWLREGQTPLWLGSLSLQKLERRLDFFTLAVNVVAVPPPGLLASTYADLARRTVVVPNRTGGVTLIAPRA